MVEGLVNTSMDLMRWHRYSSALSSVFAILGLVSAVCEPIQEEGP